MRNYTESYELTREERNVLLHALIAYEGLLGDKIEKLDNENKNDLQGKEVEYIKMRLQQVSELLSKLH